MSSPARLPRPSPRLRGAPPLPALGPGGGRARSGAGRRWAARGRGAATREPPKVAARPPQQGAPRRGAASSPRAPGAPRRAAAGAAGGSPGRPFSPPPFLSFASPPSRPVSAALPPLPPPSPIGREGRSRRLFPASLQTSAAFASPLAAAAPPARELLPELPPAARPGHPGGWRGAAGRQAAAARTGRSPPRAPVPRRPPASPRVRRSVVSQPAAAARLPLGAPRPPGLFFVLDADSRPAPTGGGLRAVLAPAAAAPCPSTSGPWSPPGCAGPRRPEPRPRRSSARWSRSARTPWSACWRSSPTCRAAPGTSSESSRARRPRWAAAPPRCTAASTPCTPPPRASTTAE